MKLRKLHNTVAMVEDDNTLHNSLALILAKIVGYGQRSYRMPQKL